MSDEPNPVAGSSGPHVSQDIVAGSMFILFGVLGYLFSLQLSFGTAAELGSAFLPRLVSVLLVVLGVGIAIGGVVKSQAAIAFRSPRPLIIVTFCVVLFALMLETLGLVAAIMLMVALSGLAGEKRGVVTTLVLGVALSLTCVAIFIWGAQLPIRVWPV